MTTYKYAQKQNRKFTPFRNRNYLSYYWFFSYSVASRRSFSVTDSPDGGGVVETEASLFFRERDFLPFL